MNKPNRFDLRDLARRAMLERGLLPEFSPEVMAETRAITGAVRETGSEIRDLRDRLWASIDNDDSRDLDQLSVAEPLAGDVVKILVAIADVDATVRAGCAIDGHAENNTTSIYTAAGIFPMLPEKLSTDLTSLGEGEERLAIVIEMEVSGSGAVLNSDIYRAFVLNHAKLAYNSLAAWLDGNAPAPSRVNEVRGMEAQLRIQDRVAQAMRGLRHQHGALTLDTIEARPVFEGDLIADLLADEKNRAKELIEDLMIAVNGVTAKYLERKGYPSLRRVLRSPDRWERIVELAKRMGERLPAEPSARELEAFLIKRHRVDPVRFADLSLSVVKLLGKGEYVVELDGEPTDGHFGLAVKDYTHSTAPNRRFPDLATQRLVKAAMAGRSSPYDMAELSSLAQHCTRQEDNANKVERQVGKSAAALLLSKRVGERFDAIVTGASEKGTWVRINRPAVEGKVVDGFEGMDVGERVRVELIGTDVERGFIDFVRAPAAARP